jgi:hypothetical protein
MPSKAMAPRERSRAWHVTGLRRTRANSVVRAGSGLGRSYFRAHGTSSPLPRRRRPLPRRNEGEQRCADLPRPRGPGHLLPHPPAGRAPLWLAHAREMPDGKPLPPRPRDTGSEPVRRDAGSKRGLRTGFQRAAPSPRPRLRSPLLVEADRIRGAIRANRRLRRQQPGSPRNGPSLRGVALAVGDTGPWGRFAWCRTTPTS